MDFSAPVASVHAIFLNPIELDSIVFLTQAIPSFQKISLEIARFSIVGNNVLGSNENIYNYGIWTFDGETTVTCRNRYRNESGRKMSQSSTGRPENAYQIRLRLTSP